MSRKTCLGLAITATLCVTRTVAAVEMNRDL